MWNLTLKVLAIYDQDYHEEYRKYIKNKRYKKYIDLVANDIQEKILNIDKKQIQELMKEKFCKSEFKIE